MGTHISHALVVRRAARAGDAPTWPTKVAGDDGQIDAGGRDLRRVPIVVVTGPRKLVMGDHLVDQRGWILRASLRPCAASGVEHGGLANELTRDAGDHG